MALDASFSYANEHMTEERIMLKIRKNKVEDDELGVFGAEKYFKGVIDEELLRKSDNGVRCGSNRPQEKDEGQCPIPKPKTPSDVHEVSSRNRGKGLLENKGPNGNNHSKRSIVKSLLASLVCSCGPKDSVKIIEAKQLVIAGDLGQNTKPLSGKRPDGNVNIKRKDCFTFPTLDHSMADVKQPELVEVKHELELGPEEKSISLEKKLTMLNWDMATPRAEILDVSRNGRQSDAGSDGSSDLFEIESFSTNENNLFLAQQETENSKYAPSEASIDWSVVTASVAESPTPKDLVVPRLVKGSGVLSGCKNLKAMRISSDEHRTTSGGEKAAVVSPSRLEWCHRSDPPTPVVKIQADTKLICTGSGLHISQNRFGVARPVHTTHSTHVSSQHLYMKQ